MVASARPGLPDLAQHLVLVGRRLVGEVRQRGRAARRGAASAAAISSSSAFSRSPTDLHLRDRLGGVLAPPRWSSPIRLLARFFSALSSSSSGSRSRRRASASSSSSTRSGGRPRRASAALARSGSWRISLRSSTREASRALVAAGGLAAGCFLPEHASRKAATCLGVGAHHDVGGHDRPGEAAVADGEEHVVPPDLALVEVGAVGALAALELSARAWSRRRWPSRARGSR